MIEIILSTGRLVRISESKPFTSAVCSDVNDPTEMTKEEMIESVIKVNNMMKSGKIHGTGLSDNELKAMLCTSRTFNLF